MTNWKKEISDEREEQVLKFGEQNHSPLRWFAILAEEVGEAAKEVVEYEATLTLDDAHKRMRNLRTELVQTAALCVAFIESLDRNELR